MKNKQTYKPNTKDYILKEHLGCQLYLSKAVVGEVEQQQQKRIYGLEKKTKNS